MCNPENNYVQLLTAHFQFSPTKLAIIYELALTKREKKIKKLQKTEFRQILHRIMHSPQRIG